MSSLQEAQKLSTPILRSHDLASAHEQLAELQRLLGRKQPVTVAPGGAAGGGAAAGAAPVQHRAPPKAPPSPATEASRREATQAAFEKYGSAEYNASAPPPQKSRSKR